MFWSFTNLHEETSWSMIKQTIINWKLFLVKIIPFCNKNNTTVEFNLENPELGR